MSWYNKVMFDFKQYVRRRLEKYVVKYFKRHHPILVVVVGAVGKTTTKNAIATVLAQRFKVRMEPTNLNSEMSVPTTLLGVKYPNPAELKTVTAWMRVFKAMRNVIKAKSTVDVIVQELATDKPGDIAAFGNYLHADIAVVTAVAEEHMENFPGGLNDVAREELSVGKFSKSVLVNQDAVSHDYWQLTQNPNILTYGVNEGQYHFRKISGNPLSGYDVDISGVAANVKYVGEYNMGAAVAAAAVAMQLNMTHDEIQAGLSNLVPVSGRMNPLHGRKDTILLDDTYNSSPIAAIAALNTLYQIEAPQRIAVLGSMNELGNMSPMAHSQVGMACDPKKLDMVITVGDEAARYLAPAAQKRGCQVFKFPGAIMAGTFVSQHMEPHAAILIKGSQNGIFTEETTKMLLDDPADSTKLVRQDDGWMYKKRLWFEHIRNVAYNGNE